MLISTLLIGADELRRLVPHSGEMFLLAGVLEVDDRHIVCVASSHREKNNPLRRRDVLPAVCGVEYAAQAMAAHGAWCHGETRSRRGMFASLREVRWHIERLDDAAEELLVSAHLEAGDAHSAAYRFLLSADGRTLVDGRATVVFAR
jgi:predicted hotdog family 3-hydroxylacyl-ACP dehydratase